MIAMIRILLAKDFARVRRNPVSVIILLGVPFGITAILGFIFGGMARGDGTGLEPIRVGIVDEDDSQFTRFLQNATGGEDFRKNVDARFVEREEGMNLLREGELSAVVIIPDGFTDDYLAGNETVTLSLIKNPAHSIYPTFAQAGMEFFVTVLNAAARNLRDDIREIVEVFDEDTEVDVLTGVVAVSGVLIRSADRIEAARDYLTPPLVTYSTDLGKEESEEDQGPGFSQFSFILIGMSAMFLLMLADSSMRDLYREARFRTLERFRTLNESLFGFVAAKVIYTIAIVAMGALILFGGGSLIFGFRWQSLPEVVTLIVCYSIFGAGMMGFVAGLAGREKRADVLNSVLVMGMAMLGGAMWPPEIMPPFIRDHVTHLVPTYWFSSAVRGLQSDYAGMNWVTAAMLLGSLGVIFTAAAAWLFRLRLEKGVKP